MARETRTSTRTTPTPLSTETKQKGMNRTRRRSTSSAGPGGEITITIPQRADKMIIQNVGSQEIRFVFGADDMTEHWSIPVGEITHTFGVNFGVDITIRSIGGVGDIQYMFWG